MAHETLTTYEHHTIPVGGAGKGFSLTSNEQSRLIDLSRLRPGFCKQGFQTVQFTQYAGLVNLGSRMLEILPKVEEGAGDPASGRATFLRLLRLAHPRSVLIDGPAHHQLWKHPLLEVFIESFLAEVSRLVRTGLLKRYLTEEEDLPLVRGRLLISRQITHNALRADRLACRFDQLTIDHPWNQILKAALVVIRPWITRLDLQRQQMELQAAFVDVSLCPLSLRDLDALVFDRQAARYEQAISWARWILSALTPNIRSGDAKAPGMLFDMNQLFESAILALFKRRSRSTGLTVKGQDTGRHLATLMSSSDYSHAFRLRPDIVISEHGQPVAVADTKWTRISAEGNGYLVPDPAHMYQIQAYAAAYPCEHFALIYPWHAGISNAKPTAYALPPIGTRKPVVSIVCIDVQSDHFTAASFPPTDFPKHFLHG
ncbi:MAG: hypothetical protein U0P81_07935 [Holophagaceae bacterium]